MKPFVFSILVMLSFSACKEPKSITFNPDDHAATSGTVGSAKVTTQVPARSMDTTFRKDTVAMRRDSLRRD